MYPRSQPRSIATRDRRVALYSHDTQGLGHVRRNIALAAAMVAAEPATQVLLISGAIEASMLPLPPRTEVLTLPAVDKSRDGGYAPAVFDMPMRELLDLRSRLIATAVRAFAPDLLVVDKLARGLGGELDATLSMARFGGGPGPRMVLGLRDVLDEPVTARREWDEQRVTDTILAHYDQVWVYGDPNVYDPVKEYALPPAVVERVVHTGYLANGRGETVTTRVGPGMCPQPADAYVLCTVGGGQDGREVVEAFVRATLPARHVGVVVTGPYMDQEVVDRIRRSGAGRDDLIVHDFVTDTDALVANAAAVVSMGGYNTVCELLAGDRPALIIPRTTPRLEQLVRARRLAAGGHLDMLAPDRVTPGRLGAWLSEAVTTTRRRHAIDLDGLRRIPALVDDLCAPTTGTQLRYLETLDVPA